MIKSLWVNAIKAYVEPMDDGQFYVMPKKDDREGFIEVFVSGSEHLDYGGGGANRFLGQKVEIDSDDFLILHHYRQWSGGDQTTVSYVLWRDIRNIKFFWRRD